MEELRKIVSNMFIFQKTNEAPAKRRLRSKTRLEARNRSMSEVRLAPALPRSGTLTTDPGSAFRCDSSSRKSERGNEANGGVVRHWEGSRFRRSARDRAPDEQGQIHARP